MGDNTIMTLLLIPIFAIINYLRGSEIPFTSKAYMAAVGGVATGLIAWDWIIGVIVFAGYWLWAVLGWGKYFIIWHGKESVYEQESEVALIDWIADCIILPVKTSEYKLWGLIAMSLRGLLIAPLFIGLGIYLQSYFPALVGLGVGLSMGITYKAAELFGGYHKYTVGIAEFLYGLIIGGGLWLSL